MLHVFNNHTVDLVQQGISENIALAASFISAFFAAFIIAYVRCWCLALEMTSIQTILPCFSITGALMNSFIPKYLQCVWFHRSDDIYSLKYFRLSLKEIAEGGSLAEEVISTIRTAQAFGTQPILEGLYNKYVSRALTVDLKAAHWQGLSFTIVFFIMYSAYALGRPFQPFF